MYRVSTSMFKWIFLYSAYILGLYMLVLLIYIYPPGNYHIPPSEKNEYQLKSILGRDMGHLLGGHILYLHE